MKLWPIPDRIHSYSEDDLFDIIELLHDCVSKGVDGRYHSWGECGWHYETFDQAAGQNDFMAAINNVLRECGGADFNFHHAARCWRCHRSASPTSSRHRRRRDTRMTCKGECLRPSTSFVDEVQRLISAVMLSGI